MNFSVSTQIAAPIEKVWQAITDFENCSQWISSIKHIEVLSKTPNSLVGLKWAETRDMFGKEVTETMWVVEAKTNEFYRVQSENCGITFDSILSVKQVDNGTELSMSFSGAAQSFGAKIMSLIMSWMMTKGMKKALQKDLDDIKHHIESSAIKL